MNPEQIVKNVVEQTTIELKKFNDPKLSGIYMMLNSEFTGIIKIDDDEIITIQAPNKVVHYKSNNDFKTAYPSPTIDVLLTEPHKTHFSNIVNG
jgi:hypothetical protein